MKKNHFLLIIFLLSMQYAFPQLTVNSLRTENLVDPIGIDITQPRFSWQLNSNQKNILQTAYEIKVGSDKNNIWSSGKISSDSSVHVAYKGTALQSGKKYQWQVRVWDNNNNASAWSETASFQTALFNSSDWKAKWIVPGYVEDSVMRPSPLFRKEFTSTKKIINATAYITAHGLYEASINGQRIGDAYLTPGWTAYHKRLEYQVYNITNLIKSGNNAIGVMLGNGWYRGIIGFNNNINVYGKDIALLFQLELTYSDGSTQTIISDGTWKSSTGAVRYAEIYNGEIIDARLDKKEWMLAGYNDAGWSGVNLADFGYDKLLATYNEPVKKHEIFRSCLS